MTAVAVAVPMVFLLAPALSFEFGRVLGWDEAQRGRILFIELLATAACATTAVFWASRVRWRPVMAVSLAGLVVGNALCALVTDFGTMVLLRAALGLCGGAAMALYAEYLSFTRAPDRVASILVFVQVTVMALSFWFLPVIADRWGLPGLLLFLAVLHLPAAALFGYAPDGAPGLPQRGAATPGRGALRVYLPAIAVLAGLACFFVAQIGAWTFFTDLGVRAGLSEDRITIALVGSSAASVIGPIASFLLRDRWGRRLPLGVALVGQAILLWLLSTGSLAFPGFLLAACLYQIFWNFVLPYAYAVLIDADVTHRLVVLMTPAQALGMGLGPMLVGAMFASWGTTAVALVGSAALAGCLALTLPLAGTAGPGRVLEDRPSAAGEESE
jgi:predicted MFS family arabinose efflux permease